MKKQARNRGAVAEEDLLPEYDFDYRQSKPNRFARQFRGRCLAVVLEPDVAEFFRTSEAVNSLLRSVISALPREAKTRRPSRKPSPPKRPAAPAGR